MPALKTHLQEEFDKLVAKRKGSSAGKTESTDARITASTSTGADADTYTTRPLKRTREQRNLDDHECGHEDPDDQSRVKKQQTETNMT